MKLGEFEIFSFVEQGFRLDGGQMFGVVPKTLWQKSIAADENNLIGMVNNLFVLKAHGKNLIFDVGFGDTLSDREKKIYAADGVSAIESGLASLKMSTDDIDYVILTHLHTDHAGGGVKKIDNGLAPRFGKAKYVFSEQEWKVATHPNERTSAVYAPERYYALKDAGQVEMIDGDMELLPGIRVTFTGGHTEGHFALKIESDGQKLFYYADIFPTSHHMRVPYVAATDLFPLETMEAKRKVLPELINDRVILAFDHDVNIPFGRVKTINDRLTVEPVIAESKVESA